MIDCLSKGLQWLFHECPELKKNDPVAILDAAFTKGFSVGNYDIECLAGSKTFNVFYQIPWYVNDFVSSYFSQVEASSVLGITRGIGDCFARTCNALDDHIECKNMSLIADDVSALQRYFLKDIHDEAGQSSDDIINAVSGYSYVYGEFFIERRRGNRRREVDESYLDTAGNEIIVNDYPEYHQLLKVSQSLANDAVAVMAVEASFFPSFGPNSVFRNLHQLGMILEAVICFDDMNPAVHSYEEHRESYLIFIRKGIADNPKSFFTAYLRDIFNEERILDNMLCQREDSDPTFGLLAGKDSYWFRSFRVEYAQEKSRRYIWDSGNQNRWDDAISAVNVIRRDEVFYDDNNSIYIPVFLHQNVTDEYYLHVDGNDARFIQFVLNLDVVDKEYLTHFLNSNIGRNLIRKSGYGSRFSYHHFCAAKVLPLPSIEDQKLIVLKQEVLEDMRVEFNRDIDRRIEEAWYE